MSYIKITNVAEEVPRLYLELLGVSTKRDNDATIGQFGSGAKFAPIMAIRNGWEWISTGFDKSGTYTMHYDYRHDLDEGIKIVQFVYNDKDGISYKDSSYSLGAGELGWTHPFQIFREAFANALDAFYEFGVEPTMSYTDKVLPPVEGEFSVYLSADQSLCEIVDNFDKYFSIKRDPIFVDQLGNKIYAKLDSSEGVRIYHKGVLVYGPELGGSEKRSLFDYDLRDVNLNEERRLSDVSTFEINNIASIIADADNYENDWLGAVPIVTNLVAYEKLDNVTHTYWEWQYAYAFNGYGWDSVNALNTDCRTFGEEMIAVCDAQYCNEDYDRVGFISSASLNKDGDIERSLSERGVRGIVVAAALYTLLESSGAKARLDKSILGEAFDTTFVDLEGYDLEFFQFAIASVATYDSAIMNYPVKVMEDTPRNSSIMGKAMNLKINNVPTVIVVNHQVVKARNMKQLIATLIHELDHAETGALDGSRDFRDAADNRLGDLIVKHYCNATTFMELMNKTIVF